jgi:uncharacterized linocin/CFP29 family protein
MNYGKMTSATTANGAMTNSAMANGSMGNRDQLKDWAGTQNWDGIDAAVDCQNELKVARKFIDPHPLPGATSAPRSIIDPKTSPILTIKQSDPMPLIEIKVQFALTQAQVRDEVNAPMAATLANRAGTLLALAEDLLIFQGDKALDTPLFQTKAVDTDATPPFIGLVDAAPADQVIPVYPVEVDPADLTKNRYGENTFAAVAQAYALLQKTHYGRCALVLHTNVYADTYSALPTTLAVPAERIIGLVPNQFHSSSALPPFTGILVAIDGETMDLVVGQGPFPDYQKLDNNLHFFLHSECFALRLKETTAVVRLDFQPKKKDGIK